MSNLTLTSLTPDDGYWFGLGVFETIWVKQNTAVFLDEHLNRLKKSALFLGFLPDKTSASQWISIRKQEILDYLKENPTENGVLKLTLSDKNLSLTSRKNTYTKEQYEKGFALDYSKILRNETSPFTYMKTLNYADNILEKRLAKQRGYDEPIFLNTKGNRDGISEELQMLLDYFDGREPESQLAKDIDRKVFEARNNKQWRREYMSYQMELDRQYRNGREEGIKEGMEKGSELATENINKLLKILIVEKKYDEIEKISENKEYQKELMKKYNIIED